MTSTSNPKPGVHDKELERLAVKILYPHADKQAVTVSMKRIQGVVRLIEAREKLIREQAEKKAESSMAVLVYRAIKHRMALGYDIKIFIEEQEKWHLRRLKRLNSSKTKLKKEG